MRKEEEDMSSSNNIEEIEGGNRSLPAPFLTKTYDLVEDPETDEIVSWAPEGLVTFVVWRPAEFARDILPNYFKHNNFSSFVRQLNTYGFRKIVPDRWEFANEFFRKGEKHLLSDIHRRKSCSSSSPHVTRPWAEGGDPWDSYSPIFLNSTNTINTNINNSNIINNINNNRAISLLDENQRLRSDNAVLICELTRLRKLYTDAVSFVQQNLQHHFNNNNNKGLPLSNIMNNNNNSGKLRELCKLAPGPNKSDPQVQKSPPSLEPVKEEEAEVEERRKKSSCNSSNPPPPKLFGVPLLLQHHHVTNPSGPKVPVDMDLSLRLPVSKRARILSLDSPCFW